MAGELVVHMAVAGLQLLQKLLLVPHLGQNGPVLGLEGGEDLLLVVQHGLQGKSEFLHRSAASSSLSVYCMIRRSWFRLSS